MKKFNNYFLPIISGILAVVSLLSAYTNYFVLIALIPLFLFLYNENRLKRLWLGVLFYHLFFAATIGILIIGEPLILLFTSLTFSFLGLAIWLVKKYLPAGYFWPAAPILFVLFEFIRSTFVFLPVKLYVLGNALGSTWFLFLGRLAGMWGLSLFIVIINLLFVWLIIKIVKKEKIKLSLVVIGGIIVLIVLANLGLEYASQRQSANRIIKIAVVSFPMTGPEGRLKYKEMFSHLASSDDTLAKAYADDLINDFKKNISSPADFIFLPSNLVERSKKGDGLPEIERDWGISNNGPLIRFSQRLVKELSSNVVIGMATIEKDDKKYISILFFNKNGELKAVHRKIDLVIGADYWPFGSWVPFWLRWKASIGPDGKRYIEAGYSRGDRPIKPEILDDLSIGTLICSEAKDGSYYSETKEGGANLAFVTINNIWVKEFSMNFDKHMFLNHQRINSIFYNLPVVINGKNNDAGIILPNGTFNINKQINYNEMTVWQGEVGIQ